MLTRMTLRRRIFFSELCSETASGFCATNTASGNCRTITGNRTVRHLCRQPENAIYGIAGHTAGNPSPARHRSHRRRQRCPLAHRRLSATTSRARTCCSTSWKWRTTRRRALRPPQDARGSVITTAPRPEPIASVSAETATDGREPARNPLWAVPATVNFQPWRGGSPRGWRVK